MIKSHVFIFFTFNLHFQFFTVFSRKMKKISSFYIIIFQIIAELYYTSQISLFQQVVWLECIFPSILLFYFGFIADVTIEYYSLTSKIRRKISFEYNAFLRKTLYFEFLCEELQKALKKITGFISKERRKTRNKYVF